MATIVKGSRSITKFRGGYEDPHSHVETNLPPDTRLPGSGCIDIDYESWTDMETLEALQNRYVAISYKHDLRYPDRKKGAANRSMRAPPVVVDEAIKCMHELDIKKYWHDGGKPLWKDELPTCKGSYPYLLEGGKVVIIPPFCSDSIVDVRSWCPYNHPEAARGMLVMSRYKIVETKGEAVLKRRRNAGVPSVAWGDANRVWLLCEAFCGSLRGEVFVSTRSLRRLHTFLEEINFAIEGLRMLEKRKSRKPALNIARSLLELAIIRSDVEEYISIITNPEVRNDGLKLSNYFVERMAIAGSSYEADRTLLGAVTTFLLEQKFGMGISPQDALAELENSDDPFVTALTVASTGNSAFPLGMTKVQTRNAIILAALRTEVTQHIQLNEDAIMNQWPQPQGGRCYAGTITNSAWKNIFLNSLYEGRCMGLERNQEKQVLLKRVGQEKEYLTSPQFRSAQEKHQRYRFWRIIFSPLGSFSETTTNDPLFLLFEKYDFSDMPEISLSKLKETEAYQQAFPNREAQITQLENIWADRQKRYKLLVSGDMPVAVSPDGRYFLIYVMDSYDLEGIGLESVETLTRNGEALLVLKKDEYTYELAKTYHGRMIQFDIRATPLLQVVITTECTDTGHLVAMRRVWNLSANSKVSIPPSKLSKIDSNRDMTDGKALLRDEIFQPDRVIPMSLSEKKMKEFGPKYSVISTTHGTPVSPRSVTSIGREAASGDVVWAQISESLYTPWLGRLPAACASATKSSGL